MSAWGAAAARGAEQQPQRGRGSGAAVAAAAATQEQLEQLAALREEHGDGAEEGGGDR